VVEQAAILASGALIEACDVGACLNEWQCVKDGAAASPVLAASVPDSRSLDEVQRDVVLRTVERFQGNLTKAAHELGIARSTLRHRLRRYGRR
jgi:DNA-binding NtrC family response regulator